MKNFITVVDDVVDAIFATAKRNFKKIKAYTGVAPVTPAMPVQRSTSWVNKPTGNIYAAVVVEIKARPTTLTDKQAAVILRFCGFGFCTLKKRSAEIIVRILTMHLCGFVTSFAPMHPNNPLISTWQHTVQLTWHSFECMIVQVYPKKRKRNSELIFRRWRYRYIV